MPLTNIIYSQTRFQREQYFEVIELQRFKFPCSTKYIYIKIYSYFRWDVQLKLWLCVPNPFARNIERHTYRLFIIPLTIVNCQVDRKPILSYNLKKTSGEIISHYLLLLTLIAVLEGFDRFCNVKPFLKLWVFFELTYLTILIHQVKRFSLIQF